MSVTDSKLDPNAEAAVDELVKEIVTAINLAGIAVFIHQFRTKARKITGVEAFARTVAAAITFDVGLVQPGTCLDAPTLGAAGNNTGIKQTNAVRSVAPDGTYRNKAITDNMAFSLNHTINVANAAGQFWGAVRIQQDAAGAYSTKVVSADQAFAVEADAVNALPLADADKINIGYVTVRTKANVSFTFNVGVITGAGGGANDAATVNWNPITSGYASVLTGAVTPVATDIVQGVLQAGLARVVAKKYALLVAKLTTDGTGAATNLHTVIRSRPFPLDGEVQYP